MAYTIRPATLNDALTLKAGLAPADAAELQASQVLPLDAITASLRDSLRPVSVFDKNGRLAAIAGVVPMDARSQVGAPWMLTTRFANTEPVAFVKQAKAWVDEQLHQYLVLAHQVYVFNTQHIKLLQILGFKVDPPKNRPASLLFLPFAQFSPYFTL